MKSFSFTSGRALPRRSFLKTSSVLLALPWLPSMQAAFAGTPGQPKRFLGILNYYSFHAPYLFPRTPGKNYDATPYLDLLSAHRADYTIISGLNHPGVRDGHASDKSFFTGALHPGSASFRNTVSLDQIAAETIGRATRYPSLNFACGGSRSCSYTRNGAPNPAETSPGRAFARLFLNGSRDEIAAEVAQIERGRSILDRVAGQAKTLQRDLGAADREKLDQYFTAVRDLEKQLQQSAAFAQRPKPDPRVAPMRDAGPGEDIVRFGQLLDVARLAFETDQTRVVTLYFQGTSKTPSKPADTFAYHDLSHHGQDTGKIERLAMLERDLLQQWGEAIGKMKSADEGGRRLLDQTIMVLGAAMGNASSHDATNLPILLAGGGFRHGQHLAFDPHSTPPLCDLWVQLLQQIGVPAEKFATSKRDRLPGLDSV